MSDEERNKRAAAGCLATCLEAAFPDDPDVAGTVIHLKRRAKGKAQIKLEFQHAGDDGTLLNVEFITPPGATPKMLGHACAVLLGHCMALNGNDAEVQVVVDDIIEMAWKCKRFERSET